MTAFGDRDGGRIVRRLSVNAAAVAHLRASLESIPCACGHAARRVTVEYDPIAPPKYGTPAFRAAQRGPVPVRVTAWCGDVDGAHSSWCDESSDLDPGDVAMCECDL